MWIRRATFSWLLPAALVLPLWLFVGWGVFSAGGWAFLWVLFIAVPSVLLGQLALALIVRARPSVRAERAVSWADVAGFGAWHLLTVALGFYGQAWWGLVFAATVLVGVGLFWWEIRALLREVRGGGGIVLRATDGTAYIPAARQRRTAQADHEVIVVSETPHRAP